MSTTVPGQVELNSQYCLTGKITLPTKIDDQTITSISNFNGQYHKITHIFWADPPENENDQTSRGLQKIKPGAFYNSTFLEYYEQPNTCQFIGENAFSGCTSLGKNNNILTKSILNPVRELEGTIFNNCISLLTIYIPGHSYDKITGSPFGGLGSTQNVELGSASDPCLWEEMFTKPVFDNEGQIIGTVLYPGHTILNQIGFRTSGTANIYAAPTDNMVSIVNQISSNLNKNWIY